MKTLSLAASLTLALLTCACLPVTSKTPVGSTRGLAADAALAGTWKLKLQGSADNSPLWAVFVPAKDGSFTILLAGTEVKEKKAEGHWMPVSYTHLTLPTNREV